MKYLKIKSKKYLQISVVSFNNWNRVFERCMHILRFDLNMPFYEDNSLSLHSFLRFVFPPDDINCNSQFSEKDELELADKFLAACLSFLIDTED